MLEVEQLTKKYRSKVVLEDIDLQFSNETGIYGLLGRNGVGKTTLLKMISNQSVHYQGRITYDGQSVHENPALEGKIFCAMNFGFKDDFFLQNKLKTILQVMPIVYSTFDVDYAKRLLEDFGLRLKDKYRKLSSGNKTLVLNILALASGCPVTLFDEPTNGLDSVNREKFFKELMANYAKKPRLFILSTHLIQEVQNYLTDVVILKDKQVLLNEPLEDIQEKSYQIIGGETLSDKNVLSTEQLGNQSIQYVFDRLSEEDFEEIQQAGGSVSMMDLQTLFNRLMEGE